MTTSIKRGDIMSESILLINTMQIHQGELEDFQESVKRSIDKTLQKFTRTVELPLTDQSSTFNLLVN
jgi:hypothetical protein